MKTHSLFLLVLFVVVCNIRTTFGQKANQGLRFGINAHTLLSVKNWNNFQAGIGGAAQLWVEKSLFKNHRINLALGYRNMMGYQMKSIVVEERFFPEEFQSEMITREVASLSYLDAAINWQFRLKEHSPWSIGAGLRWSFLTNWKADEQRIIWLQANDGRILENGGGFGSSTFVQSNQSTPLEVDNFNRQDYGLLLHVGFELTKGLQLKASYDQGFEQVFRDQLFGQALSYRVSTFSLGFAARLF